MKSLDYCNPHMHFRHMALFLTLFGFALVSLIHCHIIQLHSSSLYVNNGVYSMAELCPSCRDARLECAVPIRFNSDS